MKNIKKVIQSFLGLYLLIAASSAFAQPISNHFFGENAWMPDTIGNANACPEPPCILYGKLHKQWKTIKDSKTSIVRFGGIAPDRNMPTNFQYIRMIDSIRANGMEPIIQVPFYNYRYTATQAAEIVHYINVIKGKNIKYWIIGNEPDLSYSYTTAAEIANYFKPFASAMKNIDPSILIIGPEIASFNQAIMNGLTTPNGPADITGRDAAGRYYLDVISFHTYPFSGTQSRSEVVTKLTAAYSLDANLIYLNARVAACNIAHSRIGAAKLKTAITEANINWQNNPSDNLSGSGANSFIGAQFISEMMGIGMKNSLDFINLWSVIEGNTTASNIGFIDPATNNKKPSFYHFKMMAENFNGNYITSSTNQLSVKSIACQNAINTTVMILNEDQTNNYNFSVGLNNADFTGSNALKINVSAGISEQYDGVVPSQSTLLLTFNSAGTLIRKTEYSLTTHAMANLAPTVTEFMTTDLASNEAIDNSPFVIKNLFPNPSVGTFTVELNRENGTEKDFNVQIFNLVGQEIYNKNSTFTEGKEVIELDPSISSGEYIVRVKEEGNNNYLVKKIILQK